MKTAHLLFALCALAACSNTATTPPPATSTTPPPAASTAAPVVVAPASAPVIATDGAHFASEVAYQGECMPAGSRGGCYRFVFSPDGTARHLLLDAWDNGTYRIEGNAIVYRSSVPDAKDDRVESNDGFLTLDGGYRYTP